MIFYTTNEAIHDTAAREVLYNNLHGGCPTGYRTRSAFLLESASCVTDSQCVQVPAVEQAESVACLCSLLLQGGIPGFANKVIQKRVCLPHAC